MGDIGLDLVDQDHGVLRMIMPASAIRPSSATKPKRLVGDVQTQRRPDDAERAR